MRHVHIIGVPLDMGGGRRGVDMGPSAFRIAGLGERLTTLGYPVVDGGDLVAPIPEVKALGDPSKKYIREIARVCERVYKTSLAALERGGIPIVLGGDHSLAAGSVAATADYVRREHKPLGLIWVDAHGDMNTPSTSASGNVHGMPLAALLGPEPAELSSIGGFSPTVLPQHTVLLGVRNLDEREKVLVRDSGVHVFTMKDIDRLGVAAICRRPSPKRESTAIPGRGSSRRLPKSATACTRPHARRSKRAQFRSCSAAITALALDRWRRAPRTRAPRANRLGFCGSTPTAT